MYPEVVDNDNKDGGNTAESVVDRNVQERKSTKGKNNTANEPKGKRSTLFKYAEDEN